MQQTIIIRKPGLRRALKATAETAGCTYVHQTKFILSDGLGEKFKMISAEKINFSALIIFFATFWFFLPFPLLQPIYNNGLNIAVPTGKYMISTFQPMNHRFAFIPLM